ncbi:MAG: hypothetical protein IPG17_33370 [Sandaracinaceae bacterium]|nr:hypothetical protein [Sandaracinaceae bacterium]
MASTAISAMVPLSGSATYKKSSLGESTMSAGEPGSASSPPTSDVAVASGWNCASGSHEMVRLVWFAT